MLKALSDIFWLIGVGLGIGVLSVANLLIFLYAVYDPTILPVVAIAALGAYLASRWLGNLAEPENPDAPKPKGLAERVREHWVELRGKA